MSFVARLSRGEQSILFLAPSRPKCLQHTPPSPRRRRRRQHCRGTPLTRLPEKLSSRARRARRCWPCSKLSLGTKKAVACGTLCSLISVVSTMRYDPVLPSSCPPPSLALAGRCCCHFAADILSTGRHHSRVYQPAGTEPVPDSPDALFRPEGSKRAESHLVLLYVTPALCR